MIQNLYLEYEDFLDRFLEVQKQYSDILSEKERLFEMTQPKAINYEKERVDGGEIRNSFDNYLTAKERKRIDERLQEAKDILEHRDILLKCKEAELRHSKGVYDIIYKLYFLDHMRVSQIALELHYSRSQVHRITKRIKNNVKRRHNATI